MRLNPYRVGPRKARGNTLLELLLAMGIMAMMGAYLMRETASSRSILEAKLYSDAMLQLHAAATNYGTAYQGGIVAAASSGTSPELYCMVNVNPADGTGGTTASNTTLKTCAVDVTWLKWKGFVPADFRETTPEGSRWAVIFKVVGTGTLEGIVVAATTVGAVTVTPTADLATRGESLERAAMMAGTRAGVIPRDTGQPCPWHATDASQQYICGTQGAWRVKVGDFVN